MIDNETRFNVSPQAVETHEPEQEDVLSAWDVLERRRKMAPELCVRELHAPSHIAERRGTTLEGLERSLCNEIAEMSEKLREACSVHEQWLPLIDDLYHLWVAYRNGDPEIVDLSWAVHLDAFDSFSQHFLPDATLHARAWFGQHVAWFVNEYEQASGWMQVQRYAPPLDREGTDERLPGMPVQTYNSEADWVLMPDEYGFDAGLHFVDRAAIEEVVSLLERGYVEPDYTHASGSAALQGIAAQGALVNSRTLVEVKQPLASGETTQDVASDADSYRGRWGVYADRGGPHHGYNTLRWFGEWHVTFGIDQDRQEQYMATTDVRYGYHKSKLVDDQGGEGVVIGHQVPLSTISRVYCWARYRGQTEQWVHEHCPHAEVVSLEAARLLGWYGREVFEIAEREGVAPVEAWKKLAREG